MQQAFSEWLEAVEAAWKTLATPLQIQYDPQGLTAIWTTEQPLPTLVQSIALLSARTDTNAAIDQGDAIYDAQRAWCCSTVPERLPALLKVGQHYEAAFVLGEAASATLSKKSLDYLTRSYFPGAQTAVEVYAWKR